MTMCFLTVPLLVMNLSVIDRTRENTCSEKLFSVSLVNAIWIALCMKQHMVA